jgi:long-chain acyl-CoA synthetase
VTVWQAFEAAAERFPDRIAVQLLQTNELVSWPYRQLHEAAQRCATDLISRGVMPGDRCAIFADNEPAWCAAYLGILRAGAIAVPLDTNYSSSQVATIARDAGIKTLFVNRRLMPNAREAVAALASVALIDVHSAVPEPTDRLLAPIERTSADPAVILYTSGTTADPKGVVLTHGNLLAERDAAFEIVSVSEHDSVLGVLPLFHALGQLATLLLPFLVGARVVFLESVSSTTLVRALSEQEITVFACVPQFFYLIHQRVTQEAARGGVIKKRGFAALLQVCFWSRRLGINAGRAVFGRIHRLLGRRMRFFVTGGSRFDPAIGRDFYALGFTILQAYGLTETSGAATMTAPGDAHLDTVGRALPGQQIRIMPSEDSELDGEIAIRGSVVMKGYYNRPEATAAVMRDGWFMSGDLGRLDAAGRLTITGRKKEVIVLSSGKSIYPEEIESRYRQSAFIKEICVLGLSRDDEPSAERLFAVVVPDMDLMRARKIVNAGDLLRFEIEGQSVHLPAHKRVLGYDVWFEPLPRTTTGKLKRHEIARRVKEQGNKSAATGSETAATDWLDRDSHAASIVAVLSRRAPNRAITPESNLELDLGMDSMERVELITEIEQRFNLSIPGEQTPQIFTVVQLIEATRTGASAPQGTTDDSWAVMLRDLPSPNDPVLGALLVPKPIAARIFFMLPRILRLVLPRIEATGIEHVPRDGAYIISPNHQGYLDPFIVCSALPFSVYRQLFFVGAAEYFETPLMAWIAKKGNCVPVDPDANLIPAMKAGAFGLANGKILMLFPEGERSIDGTVKRFKKGGPILARYLGVPIVPVAIRGAFEVWPRNRRINWSLLLPGQGHRIRLSFGPPFQVAADEDPGQAAERLQTEVQAMWDRLGH